VDSGLALTATSKWYHRRAVQLLRAVLPEAPFFHAVTWEPVYGGVLVTRSDWWLRSAVVAQRVLKEWRVIPQRLADGSLREVELVDGPQDPRLIARGILPRSPSQDGRCSVM
jgi:hypothetical protein